MVFHLSPADYDHILQLPPAERPKGVQGFTDIQFIANQFMPKNRAALVDRNGKLLKIIIFDEGEFQDAT